jgi:hypothetical protein
MRVRYPILTALACFMAISGWSQAALDTSFPALGKLKDQYVKSVTEKSLKVAEGLEKETLVYLQDLQNQEAKLQSKLQRIDSTAAKNIFANSASQFAALKDKINAKSSDLVKRTGRYLPWLDSAAGSLKFLGTKSGVLSEFGANEVKIKAALNSVKALRDQLNQASNVKDFIRQRKEFLAQQLKKYDLGSSFKRYNQTAHYYTQEVNEYKAMLEDPDKVEKKALGYLKKLPLFQQFMHDHGELAGLFDVPENYAGSVAGLQTQSAVQNIIQSQMVGLGPNGREDASQRLNAAQSELSKLRNQFPSSGSTEDMPDFKPKEEKTKSFLKRLEYGTNIQSTRSSYYFPSTTDIGLSLGYKLGKGNVIGIGASYKLGWGRDIQHVSISSQGAGLRSFVDIKLKGSFFISGGFEYNYQQVFSSLREIYDLNTWHQSGLLGISKIISLKTKYFKKTKLQLLWDFLSYRQVPQTQPIKLRVGYNF